MFLFSLFRFGLVLLVTCITCTTSFSTCFSFSFNPLIHLFALSGYLLLLRSSQPHDFAAPRRASCEVLPDKRYVRLYMSYVNRKRRSLPKLFYSHRRFYLRYLYISQRRDYIRLHSKLFLLKLFSIERFSFKHSRHKHFKPS